MKSVSYPTLAFVAVVLMGLFVVPQVLGSTAISASSFAGLAALHVARPAHHVQRSHAQDMTVYVYIVQHGDTLSSMAERFGTTIGGIVDANDLADPDRIWVGQRLTILLPPTPPPEWQMSHTVQKDETLSSIARQYGTTVAAIAAANRIVNPDLIWIGQRLILPVCSTPTISASPTPPDPIPTATSTASPPRPSTKPMAVTPMPTPSCEVVHVVKPGDTLGNIARRHGKAMAAIMAANGMINPDFIWVGQRLTVPMCDPPTPVPSRSAQKWIDVNLSTQTLIAYQGSTPVLQTLISSGSTEHPSPPGAYTICLKLISQDMSGPGYYLPNVPYVMYLDEGGYALHGTYWHSSFGYPMSHGDINLPIAEAASLYEWTPTGISAVLHY
jgi:LysM repeat protein